MSERRRARIRRRSALPLLLLLLLTGCTTPRKPVLGSVATVRVVEADLSFRGRVDTGAEASSIHATAIELVAGAAGASPRVRFEVANEAGARARLELPLVDIAEVRSAAGRERRYRVPLTLAIGDVAQTVPVTLRDRSAMRQKLLVGRDLLAGRFLVDAGAP